MNSQRNTGQDTLTDAYISHIPDTTIHVPTVADSMLLPCIDCFLRIQAIEADKQACIKDNLRLEIENAALFTDKVTLEMKLRRTRRIAVGLGVGVATTGYLLLR